MGVARIGGRPAFDAWKYPFSRFDDLTVPQLLFAWGAVDIAINPPRQTSLIDIDGQATVENQYSRFTLVVVDGGLGENGTLFWSPGGTRAHRQPLSHGNIHHRTARYWLAQRVSAVIALPTFRNRLPARNRAAVSWDSRGDDL